MDSTQLANLVDRLEAATLKLEKYAINSQPGNPSPSIAGGGSEKTAPAFNAFRDRILEGSNFLQYGSLSETMGGDVKIQVCILSSLKYLRIKNRFSF
jgi:hypothetical protein